MHLSHFTFSGVLWSYPDSQSKEAKTDEDLTGEKSDHLLDSGFSIIYEHIPGSSNQSKMRDSETTHNKKAYQSLIVNEVVLTMYHGAKNVQMFLPL